MDKHEERGAQHKKCDAQFADELTQAIRRVDAPEGFAVELRERASAEATRATASKVVVKHGKILAFPRFPVWTSGVIAAAVVVVGCLAGGEVHLRHVREQSQATAEFEASVQITNQVLQQTRQQLERAGISFNQQ